MDIEFIPKTGNSFRLSDLRMDARDFIVSSIEMESYSDTVSGRHGYVNYGADYRKKTITVPFYFKPQELHDLAHGRDELFGLITEVDGYYIREMRKPRKSSYEFVAPDVKASDVDTNVNRYTDGKRYFVRLVDVIELEQGIETAEGVMKFETIELPFAESSYTTMDLHSTGYVDTAERYGNVDGINEDMVQYSFTGTTFSVWNAGNVTVEPEFMKLTIRLGNASVTNELQIKNLTTDQTFIYTGTFSGNNFMIDGLKVYRGLYNELRLTNRQFISLVPGENKFQITGASYDSADIDFRFYYK